MRRAERRDGNHHPARPAHEEEVQVVALGAVGSLGLNVNAVDAVEHVEVIDVDRPRKGLHRGENVRHRNAQQLRLVAVHVEIELRNIALHRRRKPREFGPLRGIVHQRIDGALQLGVGRIAARFEHHLETARIAQTGNHGRTRQVDPAFGIARHLGAHALHHLAQAIRIAVAPRFEDHGQLAARLIGAHAGTRTRHVEHVLHVGIVHQKLDGPVGHLARTLDSRPFGQLQLHGEIALILLRHEALGHQTVHQPDADQHDAEGGQHAPRVLQRPSNHPAVESVARRQSEIDAAENPVFLFPAFGFEEKRTHHGAERQRHDRRNDHRHGDRNGELAVELARDSRKEAHRDEHGAQHERHGDQGAAQAAHRLFGRLVRRKALLVHDAVHVLDHHDGVVHHDADGENQSQQRQHVEREAEDEHHAEGADQRNGHRHDRDERRAPALERKEDHQNHQQQRFEKRPVDVVDRLGNVGGHVERNLIADSLREIRADLLHDLLDRSGDLHGVGAGKHVDIQDGGVPAVDTALGAVGGGFERNARHVLQTDDRTVGIGPHDDILEFADR